MVVSVPCFPVTLPLFYLVGMPALVLGTVWFAARAVWHVVSAVRKREPRRLCAAGRDAAFALTFASFVLIMNGVVMNVDIALMGQGPSLEEKLRGRRIAQAGAYAAGLAATSAYLFDLAFRPR